MTTNRPTSRRVFAEARGTLGLAIAGVVVAAGCGVSPDAHNSPGTGDSVFQQAISDAIAGGASAAQVQILRDAGDAGALTLEDVKRAVGDTFACFEAAGMGHSEIDVITQEGLPRVSYNFSGIPGASEDQSLGVADSCMNTNSLFVEFLYIGQPQSRDVTDRFFTDHVRTPLIECLRSMSVEVDDSATNDELWLIAVEKSMAIAAPYASGELPGAPTDCVSELVTNPNSWG